MNIPQMLDIWHMGHIAADAPLVVGVSGGVDSLVLWHWLVHTAVHPPHHLTAVYIHHRTRPAADDEAELVQRTAAQWQVPCRIVGVDVPTGTGSWEAAARQVRYRALGQVAAELGGHIVATAHHADDQAETVLHHLLRGSGLAGLRGMRPWSALPEWGLPYQLVRPLLHQRRTAIEAYAAQHHLTPAHDETNQETRFTRNRLRHELLPLLGDYNPQAIAHLAQTAELLAADYELVQAALDEAWHQWATADPEDEVIWWPAAPWRTAPLAVRRGLLRRAVATLLGHGRDLGLNVVEAARHLLETGHANQRAELGHSIWAEIQYNGPSEQVVVWRGTTAVRTRWLARQHPQLTAPIPHPLAVPGEVALANGWRLTAEPQPDFATELAQSAHHPWRMMVRLPQGAHLTVRPRRAGERMHPLGATGSAKLKKIMNEAHLPAPLRDLWPLVADEQGVLWLVGHVVGQRTAVADGVPVLLRLIPP